MTSVNVGQNDSHDQHSKRENTQLSPTAEKKRYLREVLETDNLEIMALLLEEAGFLVDGCDCVGHAHPGDHQAWLRKAFKDCMPCIELHDRLTRLGFDEEEFEHPAFKQAGTAERMLALLDEAEATLPRDKLVSRIMAMADEALAPFIGAGSAVNNEARK